MKLNYEEMVARFGAEEIDKLDHAIWLQEMSAPYNQIGSCIREVKQMWGNRNGVKLISYVNEEKTIVDWTTRTVIGKEIIHEMEIEEV